MLGNVMQTGLAGYQRNVAIMGQAAQRLANPQNPEPVRDIVDLLRGSAGAKANALVIRVAKETEDYLFDALA